MRQVYIEKHGLSGRENLTDNNQSVLGKQTGLRSFALFPSFPRHRGHSAPPALRPCPVLGYLPCPGVEQPAWHVQGEEKEKERKRRHRGKGRGEEGGDEDSHQRFPPKMKPGLVVLTPSLLRPY